MRLADAPSSCALWYVDWKKEPSAGSTAVCVAQLFEYTMSWDASSIVRFDIGIVACVESFVRETCGEDPS